VNPKFVQETFYRQMLGAFRLFACEQSNGFSSVVLEIKESGLLLGNRILQMFKYSSV